MNKLFIITPVLNESENVENLVSSWKNIMFQVKDYEFHFIVIDDGSTDNTSQSILRFGKNLNIQILKHETNKGPGAAFATAFRYLHSRMGNADVIVTMEGDNTSRVETLLRMLSRQKNEMVEVVLASPFTYGGAIKTDMSLFRTFLSTFANGLIKLVLGIRGIHTFSSFFRVYTSDAIRKLQATYGPDIIYSSGFEGMVEMLAKIVYLQMSASEVPLQLDWSLRKGKSKMKVIKTSLGYFKLFYKLKSKPRPIGLS